MSDFTIDDTMAEIRYELDDREIYNDIRSEVGLLVAEIVVDADPTYEWLVWTRFPRVLVGETATLLFQTNYVEPSDWQIVSHSATYKTYDPTQYHAYYDYSIAMSGSFDWFRLVKITNTGIHPADFRVVVKVKYTATDAVTHEEITPVTLSVRATDATSISEYGRRVMNLTWSEGTPENEMQVLVDHYLARYKDPVARLRAIIKGKTDALRTQFITREISDLVTVVCTNLGLNADYFINSISISDDPTGIPICNWGLEAQRAYEALTLLTLDTSVLDGSHVLGS